jgi:hypothetical protein
VVRYVALAHNRRVDGRIKPDVLMNLGRADQVDVAGLRRLAASISKHYGDTADGLSDRLSDQSRRSVSRDGCVRCTGGGRNRAGPPAGISLP